MTDVERTAQPSGGTSRGGHVFAVLGVFLASAAILLTMLPSIFVYRAPLSLFGGCIVGLLFLARRLDTSSRFGVVMAAGLSAALCWLYLGGGQPDIEVVKASIGFFLFLTTLALGNKALDIASRWPVNVVDIFAALSCAFFVLEYVGIYSLKDAGVVSWYQTDSYVAGFDRRASGLFSEPSWFALGSMAAAFFLAQLGGWARSVLALITVLLVVLSGSAIGLLLAILFAGERLFRLEIREAPPGINFVLRALALIIAAGGMIMVSTDLPLTQLEKLASPLQYGSGVSRFLAPLAYVQDTLISRPLEGFGFAYMTEHLLGLTGMAVLPVNVFIELGLIGLFIYGAYLYYFCFRISPSALRLLTTSVVLFSIGMQYSPFQAMILCLIVFDWRRMEGDIA